MNTRSELSKALLAKIQGFLSQYIFDTLGLGPDRRAARSKSCFRTLATRDEKVLELQQQKP